MQTKILYFMIALVAGITVSWGCAEAVSEQPKTARAARVVNIQALGFMTILVSLRCLSAIGIPFDDKTNCVENVSLPEAPGRPEAFYPGNV